MKGVREAILPLNIVSSMVAPVQLQCRFFHGYIESSDIIYREVFDGTPPSRCTCAARVTVVLSICACYRFNSLYNGLFNAETIPPT